MVHEFDPKFQNNIKRLKGTQFKKNYIRSWFRVTRKNPIFFAGHVIGINKNSTLINQYGNKPN